MKEKDKSLFEYNGKTYKLVKQPKEVKSCRELCSLCNYGCEKLCVKAYNELDNPDFGLIEAVFVEVDEAGYKETGMKENEIDQKEQKATWSEDDEETLNSAISFVEHSAFTTIGKGRNYVISWLKSLKDRMAWRPTEKQMKALGDAIFDAEYDHRLTEMNALLSLDKDLKNL